MTGNRFFQRNGYPGVVRLGKMSLESFPPAKPVWNQNYFQQPVKGCSPRELLEGEWLFSDGGQFFTPWFEAIRFRFMEPFDFRDDRVSFAVLL